MTSHPRLLLSPCCLCLLLSAIHFYQAQQLIYVLLCVLSLCSVLVKHPICLRLNQAGMLLLCGEWINRVVQIYIQREDLPQAWLQIAIVVGAIGLLHFVSALLFQHHRIRRYFGYPRLYLFR
ncbi:MULTISPECIES: hypothetical protein [unclassified Agarivorans]|uniref:hypothetical protein n=1 Tax=unclassified Agarivorans TaxID=2636026 RepID=UPI003D7E766F